MSMSPTSVGELNTTVRVREWQDMPAIGGGIDQTFAAGTKAWAKLVPVGAALFYGTAQIEAGVTHRMTTWRTTALNERTVTAAHVVESEGMRYRVRRATPMDQERQFLLVDLTELGAIP
jgi:hypothetical protein